MWAGDIIASGIEVIANKMNIDENWQPAIDFFSQTAGSLGAGAVNQLNGLFKVKDYKLRHLIIRVRELEREIGRDVFYHHIPRKKNKEADSLVKSILLKP